MESVEYKKISRRVRTGGTFSFGFRILYDGPDHLLLIDTTTYTEDYKRFYYRDIQCILVQATKRYKKLNIVFGILLFVSILFLPLGRYLSQALAAQNLEGIGYFVAGLGMMLLPVALVALIVNLVKGPSCKTTIQTAVQQEELSPLRRIKKANKIVPFLRNRVLEAQGELDPASVLQLEPALTAPPPTASLPRMPPPLGS